jgi:hypothetical protein
VKTIFSERAATEIAVTLTVTLTDPNVQLYWFKREVGMGGQTLLRRAIEIAGLEYREVHTDLCYPLDLEELFSNLPDKPGVIILDNYDRSSMFVANLITFTMLYYEYRRMITVSKDSIPISTKWKFIVTTEPNAWIPDPTLHKRLYHIS